MYYFGDGVLKDLTIAHMWWNIASAIGNEKSRTNLNIIETQMSREQIAEATERAKVCMASNYKDCD